MRESIELAMYYVQEETGFWINDYTVYAFVDLENFLDVFSEQLGLSERRRAEYRESIIDRGDNWGSIEYTRTSGAGVDIFIYGEPFFSNDNHRLQITAHEYFHVIQWYGLSAFEAGVGSHDVVYKTGPAWLQEGSAIYVQKMTIAHEGLAAYGASRLHEMARSRETATPLRSTETYNGLKAADGVGYPLGFMAVDFLVENFGDLPALPALVSFYDAIGPDTTWQDAFQSTFGISIDEFYIEFEAYRLEHFPPLP